MNASPAKLKKLKALNFTVHLWDSRVPILYENVGTGCKCLVQPPKNMTEAEVFFGTMKRGKSACAAFSQPLSGTRDTDSGTTCTRPGIDWTQAGQACLGFWLLMRKTSEITIK